MFKTGQGYVHDSSGEDPSLFTKILAVWTLFMLFFVSLLYMIIAPVIVYLTYAYRSVWGALVIFLVVMSPFLARRDWPAFGKTFGFRAWRSYFALRIYKEERLSSSKNVILGLAPHGLFPLSLLMISGVCDEVFPEFQGRIPNTAIADPLLWTPVMAPLLCWLGCISVHKESIRTHLRTNNVVVIPDGIAGAFHSKREQEYLYFNNRKGFVKTALEEGSLLVPVYCFGHSQLYDVYPSENSWLARLSRRLRFSIIWFWGERWCPPVPHRVPLFVVIGRGMRLEKVADPTQEQIDMVHEWFTQELIALYNRHRESVPGYENKELIVV